MSPILPILLLTSALVTRSAPPVPAEGPVKAVRLKVEGFPAAPSLSLDPKEVTADLEAFLAGRGVPMAPGGKEVPAGTFDLEVAAISLRYSEGTCLLSVSEQLAPASTGNHPAGGEARAWSGNFMAAQAGEEGLVYRTRSVVLEMADSLLRRAAGAAGSPASVPEPAFRPDAPPALRPPPPLPQAVEVQPGQAPVRVQPPPPPYPAQALAQKVEGTVVVLLTLDPDGRPVRAVAASGPPELKAAALRYAMQWIFQPVKVDGKPVWARVELPLPFRLGN